jgi:hypothetical protein
MARRAAGRRGAALASPLPPLLLLLLLLLPLMHLLVSLLPSDRVNRRNNMKGGPTKWRSRYAAPEADFSKETRQG